jgi:hypothetical protein
LRNLFFVKRNFMFTSPRALRNVVSRATTPATLTGVTEMSITIYAFTNDRARLLEKKATFWNDTVSPEAVADIWESEGFIVTREVEE